MVNELMIKYACFLLLVSIPVIITAQSCEDCLADVKAVFETMNQIGDSIPEGKLYFMDYTVKADLRNAQNQAGKERIRALFSNSDVMILSDYMELYADSQYTFTVLPTEKHISWSNATMRFGEQIKRQYALTLQDSLFTYAVVTDCQMLMEDRKEVQKVVLNFKEKGRQLLNYNQVIFWLNPTAKLLRGVLVEFAKKGNIQRIEMQFNELNYDYQGSLKPINFADEYITNNQLNNKKYSGFELRDLRKTNINPYLK